MKKIMLFSLVLILLVGCKTKFNSVIDNGKSALQENKISDAVGYFEQAISISPKNWRGYYWLAMANKKRMRYGEFVINMDKALIYADNDAKLKIADAYYAFTKDLEAANRIENMYDAFEHILKIVPDYNIGEEYALHLGNKYYEQSFDYKKALMFYLVVEKQNLPPETDMVISYRIARCYYETGDLKNASIAYNQLLDKYPQHPKKQIILNDIGKINYELAQDAFSHKKYDEAISRATVVLNIGKPRIWLQDTRNILAASYLAKGDKANALKVYREIVANDPYRRQRITLEALKKINELKNR